jgi:hypothetical protein
MSDAWWANLCAGFSAFTRTRPARKPALTKFFRKNRLGGSGISTLCRDSSLPPGAGENSRSTP